MSTQQFISRCRKVVAVGRNYAGKARTEEARPAERVPCRRLTVAPCLACSSSCACHCLCPSAHAKELNNPLPKQPLLFLKPSSSMITNGQKVQVPRQTTHRQLGKLQRYTRDSK